MPGWAAPARKKDACDDRNTEWTARGFLTAGAGDALAGDGAAATTGASETWAAGNNSEVLADASAGDGNAAPLIGWTRRSADKRGLRNANRVAVL